MRGANGIVDYLCSSVPKTASIAAIDRGFSLKICKRRGLFKATTHTPRIDLSACLYFIHERLVSLEGTHALQRRFANGRQRFAGQIGLMSRHDDIRK